MERKTNNFANIQDVTDLFRELDPAETNKAEKLLTVVSNLLRQEAFNVGKNLDKLIEEGKLLEDVVKSVTVDVVGRMLMTSTTDEPVIQTSESALGYSQSSTFLIPGGGVFIKKTELARLGLKRQAIGKIELYD